MTDSKGRDAPDAMRLIGRVSYLLREEIRRACSENGLPLGYRALLFHIGAKEGQTQKELAEKTGLRPATVSVTIEKMERDGFVTRFRDDKDKRVIRVLLTDKGQEIDRSNRKKVEALEREFSGVLDEGEKSELSRLLYKIIDGYAAHRTADKEEGETEE